MNLILFRFITDFLFKPMHEPNFFKYVIYGAIVYTRPKGRIVLLRNFVTISGSRWHTSEAACVCGSPPTASRLSGHCGAAPLSLGWVRLLTPLLLLLFIWMPFCFISCINSVSSAAICTEKKSVSLYDYHWKKDNMRLSQMRKSVMDCHLHSAWQHWSPAIIWIRINIQAWINTTLLSSLQQGANETHHKLIMAWKWKVWTSTHCFQTLSPTFNCWSERE